VARYLKKMQSRQRAYSTAKGGSACVMRYTAQGVEFHRARKSRPWLPVRQILVFIYLVFLIRVVVVAEIGPTTYDARVADMSERTFLERAAARVMFLDPVSRSMAARVRGIMDDFARMRPEPRDW